MKLHRKRNSLPLKTISIYSFLELLTQEKLISFQDLPTFSKLFFYQVILINFCNAFVFLHNNPGDRHLDNILGKKMSLFECDSLIVTNSNNRLIISKCVYCSWFDDWRNFAHWLQCMLWERKNVTSSGESSIPYDVESARSAWRNWHWGELKFRFCFQATWMALVPAILHRTSCVTTILCLNYFSLQMLLVKKNEREKKKTLSKSTRTFLANFLFTTENSSEFNFLPYNLFDSSEIDFSMVTRNNLFMNHIKYKFLFV